MQREIREKIEDYPFRVGEVYLFHGSDRSCPGEGSLWGIFDRCDSTGIHLESMSRDCLTFYFWRQLPPYYRYFRRASRAEVRYFLSEQLRFESRVHRGRR